MPSLLRNVFNRLRPRRDGQAPAAAKPAASVPAERAAASPKRAAAASPKPRTAPSSASRTARLVPRPGPPPGRHLAYAPRLDGRADPGEVVWTWVKYEDDPHQGKDRPVLVVGRRGRTLVGLMLSSASHRDGQPNWYALGAGAWDGEHRPSWVRLDRVLEVSESGIRREGAVLDRARFDKVAALLRGKYGWR